MRLVFILFNELRLIQAKLDLELSYIARDGMADSYQEGQ
jgi:hypothetical protein